MLWNAPSIGGGRIVGMALALLLTLAGPAVAAPDPSFTVSPNPPVEDQPASFASTSTSTSNLADHYPPRVWPHGAPGALCRLADDRFTGQEQMALSKSTDGGLTWSAAQRISTVGGVNQAFTPTVRVADDGTVAVQHYDFRFDDPATTPPLTTDVWLLRSPDGGASWTEERIGNPGDGTGSFDMTTAPDALGYFVGDYAGLDFAGSGVEPGFKPFHVRANSGNLLNRTDVFSTTASLGGP
jgi:hypothetical protein